MSKEISVKVDVTPHSDFGERYSDAVIFMQDNSLRLRFVRTGNVLKHRYNDADGCPVFGWYDVEFPFYAIHYPDGQEDWTTQSIFDELNGVPVELEVEKEPVELTFTFVTEEKVGDISVTEAIQVTQVIR
ncbi:hypothetical protein AVU07_agp122 [Escherichia phage phiSUSP1]|uniref:Uncharacterized protein n=1 Tax=Escherichia phage phiSUSP1 TaxID=1718606 RepID=A0A0N9SL22_9CAUD|nr:hypothetical protein AVU07_agp122 [Escherichia phage phiSUSP1]ALH47013.1 hypothetical protein [Escherichia phage phiSUSP1]